MSKCKAYNILIVILILFIIALYKLPSTNANTEVTSAEELKSTITLSESRKIDITLQNDIEFSMSAIEDSIAVKNDADVVIDLNGNTLTFSEYAYIDVSAASLTIKNGNIESTNSDVTIFTVHSGGRLYIENTFLRSSQNTIIYMFDNSKLYLNGAKFNTQNTEVQFLEAKPEAKFDVYDYEQNEITDFPCDFTQIYNSALTRPESGNGISSENMSAEITAVVDGVYSIVVPESIDFGKITYSSDENNKIITRTGTINVEYFISDGDSTLRIYVYGSGENDAFELSNGKNGIIEYIVKDSGGYELSPHEYISEFTDAGNDEFTLEIDRSQINRAGQYSGRLIFEVAVE